MVLMAANTGCIQPPGYEILEPVNHAPYVEDYDKIHPPPGPISIVDQKPTEFKLTGAVTDDDPGYTLYYYWWIADRPAGSDDVFRFDPCVWVDEFPSDKTLVLEVWVGDGRAFGLSKDNLEFEEGAEHFRLWWFLQIDETLATLCERGE